MTGAARQYWVETEGLPLSLKCPVEGHARYTIDRRAFAVDDNGWLVVNEDQPYSVEIDSASPVQTFVIWFPRGWAEEVAHSLSTPTRDLLAIEGAAGQRSRLHFCERYTRDETAVTPAVHRIREKFLAGNAIEDGWLEEKLRDLLGRLLDVQLGVKRAIAKLPAERSATREELWNRLNRARDFLHALCDTPISLSDGARVAAMSPYHFLRSFKAAFGYSPHAWLLACRLERAKRLLSRTELPVTEICFALGYQGLGSFSTWFRRMTGCSPRAWRQATGARHAIRNNREVFPLRRLLRSEDGS